MKYKLVIKIQGKKKVSVRKFKNMNYVDIREFYEKNGEILPGLKGFYYFI